MIKEEEAVDSNEEVNEENVSVSKTAGFSLDYDSARKIAQGLGVNLDNLANLVELDGDTARLLSVGERAKNLFGKSSEGSKIIKKKNINQQELFVSATSESAEDSTSDDFNFTLGVSILDRVHQSMLLFGSGRSAALKRLLVDDGAGSDAKFWRLAQALSALYPTGTDEKRWIDGVLARKKGLGF